MFLCLTPVASANVELTVHDERLQITLMAESPAIRNPIGIAVDHQDRIYVIESHTSLRPNEYDGPESDRIRMIIDNDGDGTPERTATAAEDLHQAMSLAVSPQGMLYVVCASEIIALLDHNGDGVFDGKRTVVTLETEYQHPHYRLTGATFDDDGWLYFSRGNMGGHAFTVRGADGSTVRGYGDGGAIMRCLPGGNRLEEVATGIWNVMGMDHDRHGRLLAADNDPESRGPNRLLHIVSDGNYGYQTLYGKGGHHPLLAWDGEFPETLPIVSATREAPSAVLSGRRAALPDAYLDSVLVSCWGESMIERHALQPNGVSVSADVSILVSGSDEFRPVAMAADSKGAIYITDWASSRYPNHAKGRLWRLTAKPSDKGGFKPDTGYLESEGQKVMKEVAAKQLELEAPKLFSLLTHDDPFLTHTAIGVLAQPAFWDKLMVASKDTTPSNRLAALLALRRAHHPDAANLVTRFLSDSDRVIRMTALRWAAELRDPSLRPALDAAIVDPKVSLELLETYLASQASLSPDILKAIASQSVASAFDLPFPTASGSLEKIIASENISDHLRSLALMRIGEAGNKDLIPLLARWTRERSPALQMGAVRGLAGTIDVDEQVIPILKSVAQNRSFDPQVRAEAIAALANKDPTQVEWALPLLDDPKALVRLEAARATRLIGKLEPVLSKLEAHYAKIRDNPREAKVAEQLEFILYGPHNETKKFAKKRPKTVEQWQERLQYGGDVAGGRRLFHSSLLLCAQCHTPGPFRNSLGPSLENLGQSVDRARIVQSLIEPFKNASPAYQAWKVRTKDGLIDQGVQLEQMIDGSLKYIAFEGNEVFVSADELQSYEPIQHSIMPYGLQQIMTVQEMLELVSYLESLGEILD